MAYNICKLIVLVGIFGIVGCSTPCSRLAKGDKLEKVVYDYYRVSARVSNILIYLCNQLQQRSNYELTAIEKDICSDDSITLCQKEIDEFYSRYEKCIEE